MNDYLYEIIDDYKNAKLEEDRAEILKYFCSSIWGSKNKRRTYNKTIKFKVRNDLLDSDIGRIFNTWSEINYIGYKEMSSDKDWASLIRQKVNNIYTRYFDKNVILNKDYMELLKTPKNLYYRWIHGEDMNVDELSNIIDDVIHKSNDIKIKYQKQKMSLSWEEYKNVVEGFFKIIFDNCRLIEDYEYSNLTNQYIYELATEDNFYVKYICDSLESHMRNYQKYYYGLKRGRNKNYKRCSKCGKLIEIKNKKDFSSKYCDVCRKEIIKEQTRKRVQKHRQNKCNAS